MNLILGILGGICLVYFLILLLAGMNFSIVWLAAGLFLWGAAMARVYLSVHPAAIGKGVKVLAALVLGVGVLVFAAAQICIISGMGAKPQGKLDYLIVLGAQVHGETPSKALKLRLDAAEKAWKENGEPILLLSGGKGFGENISEAECMRRVLTEKGIPEEKMLLEDASVSTEENLRFCAQLAECREGRTGIVTNNFHVFRAGRLAKKLGYKNVCGIAAKSDWRFQIHYMVREAFALVKELLVGNI